MTHIPFSSILIAMTGALSLAITMTLAHAQSAAHTYDANGRLSQVTGPNWNTSYTYDNVGNVTNIARTTTQLSLLAVVSRKTHGTAGPFEVVLDRSVGVAGDVSVEPRAIGAGHTIVFRFNSPVTNAGTAIAYDRLGLQTGSTTTSAVGNEVRVGLTGSFNAKRIRIELGGVNGAAAMHQVALGFLHGDVDNTRVVGGGDIATVRGRSGQPANAANALCDLNASGAIDGGDVATVRGQSGQVLD